MNESYEDFWKEFLEKFLDYEAPLDVIEVPQNLFGEIFKGNSWGIFKTILVRLLEGISGKDYGESLGERILNIWMPDDFSGALFERIPGEIKKKTYIEFSELFHGSDLWRSSFLKQSMLFLRRKLWKYLWKVIWKDSLSGRLSGEFCQGELLFFLKSPCWNLSWNPWKFFLKKS